ncbi:MAG: hypothetical protein NHF98_00960 [Candidatus Bostrichicola ureolyticus]|nr:MAG: hypothetical protein NHF98_00960 [Candidatus Bostrichicola ureolyticus]
MYFLIFTIIIFLIKESLKRFYLFYKKKYNDEKTIIIYKTKKKIKIYDDYDDAETINYEEIK